MVDDASLVLWTEGDWRCEFHPGSSGDGRLVIYRGDVCAVAESTLSKEIATARSEVLRQRVLRGNIVLPP